MAKKSNDERKRKNREAKQKSREKLRTNKEDVEAKYLEAILVKSPRFRFERNN